MGLRSRRRDSSASACSTALARRSAGRWYSWREPKPPTNISSQHSMKPSDIEGVVPMTESQRPTPERMRFNHLIDTLDSFTPFTSPLTIQRTSGRTILLNLGSNENLLGPSTAAKRAMLSEVHHAAKYGDPEGHLLREKISEKLNIRTESILIGSGIDDLLGQAVRCLIEPGDLAVASRGTYPTFKYHILAYGGALKEIPYSSYRNDLDALLYAAKTSNARIVYIANPDSPTGTLCSPGDLSGFIKQLPRRCTLLLDEAYCEFASANEIIPIVEDDVRTVRFRTFSKVYGLAGARIGYLISNRELIKNLNKVRLHFGVNRIALAGASAALSDLGFVNRVRVSTDECRKDYKEIERLLNCRAIESHTNFTLFDVGSKKRATGIFESLLKNGIFVRLPGGAGLEGCVRISAGTNEQVRFLIKEIEKFASP